MQQFVQLLPDLAGNELLTTVTLTFHQRQKSRLRMALDNGEDAGLSIARGTVLRDGQLLGTEDGVVIEVKAAKENVSTARAAEHMALTQAAYHLGNRHVALQVGDGWIRYLADHVLDDMVRQLGLDVINEEAPFEPEDGAYAKGGHHHD
jgi:urease accessory protein